jgi:RimJ/RimL family protein N-acetyltransferase
MRSAVELMELHVATLYRHDAAGRMVAVNDVDRRAAPRLHLGRTIEGNIWRFRHDLPAGLVRDLEEILPGEPVPADLRRPAETFRRLHDALAAHAPVGRVWEGPAWYFPDSIRAPESVAAVAVTHGVDVGSWFPWLPDELDACQPCRAVFEGGAAVAVCFSSRNSPVAAEAGVETLEAYRWRGYATAAVAAWAQDVREQGRTPLYSTSWDNHASQALAGRLGLVMYGVDLHFT